MQIKHTLRANRARAWLNKNWRRVYKGASSRAHSTSLQEQHSRDLLHE